MKWAGAMFIIAASFWIGWLKSRSYGERVEQIRQFETALVMLESSIAYGAESMESAARSISLSVDQPVDRMFERFAASLAGWDKGAEQLWTRIVHEESTKLSLKKRDVQIVEQAGAMLGAVSRDAEKRKLQLVLKQLERQREEAAEEEKRYAGMIRSISLLCGMMTAVLLL